MYYYFSSGSVFSSARKSIFRRFSLKSPNKFISNIKLRSSSLPRKDDDMVEFSELIGNEFSASASKMDYFNIEAAKLVEKFEKMSSKPPSVRYFFINFK